MAVDPGHGTYPVLYWVDRGSHTISRALIPNDLTQQGHPQVLLSNAYKVEGLAYDWINK